MKRTAAFVGAFLFLSVAASAQSLEGVWKPAEVDVAGGPNAGTHQADVQPGLAIFTKSHYSFVVVASFQPRARLTATPTDEERGKVFGPFTANAGTYAVNGSTITYTPSVAKDPSVMDGTPRKFDVKFEGTNTVWFASKSPENVETRTKWVRVE